MSEGQTVHFDFHLGQKVKHTVLGIAASVCGLRIGLGGVKDAHVGWVDDSGRVQLMVCSLAELEPANE